MEITGLRLRGIIENRITAGTPTTVSTVGNPGKATTRIISIIRLYIRMLGAFLWENRQLLCKGRYLC
jgi:hypothetical protein